MAQNGEKRMVTEAKENSWIEFGEETESNIKGIIIDF
jgi:hypothetical protein